MNVVEVDRLQGALVDPGSAGSPLASGGTVGGRRSPTFARARAPATPFRSHARPIFGAVPIGKLDRAFR